MPDLSPATRGRVAEIAGRHGFSAAAAEVMLAAVARGRGGMAQFDHPEFGGPGQWMRGGMTMVGDMFNSALKARVEALCADLSAVFDSDPALARAPGASAPASAESAAPGGAWWPAGLPAPESTGAQNDVRYAWFAAPRRLAIERAGRVTLYDTLDHRIAGFAQQQSDTSTLSFTSQHGPRRCRAAARRRRAGRRGRAGRRRRARRSAKREGRRATSSPRSSGSPSCMRAAS